MDAPVFATQSKGIGLLTYIRRLNGDVLSPRQDEIRTSLPYHFVGLLLKTLFTVRLL